MRSRHDLSDGGNAEYACGFDGQHDAGFCCATVAAPGTVFPATFVGAVVAVVQGTTDGNTILQATCQMDVTGLLSVTSISLTGDYTVNPTTPATNL